MNIQLVSNEKITWVNRSRRNSGHIIATVNAGDDILKVAGYLGIELGAETSRTTKFERTIVKLDDGSYQTPSTKLLKKMIADVGVMNELKFMDDLEANFTSVKKQLAEKVRSLKAVESEIADYRQKMQTAYDKYTTMKGEIDNLKRSLGVALGTEAPSETVIPMQARSSATSIPEYLNPFIGRNFSITDIVNRHAGLRNKYGSVSQKVLQLCNKGILKRVDRGVYTFAG